MSVISLPVLQYIIDNRTFISLNKKIAIGFRTFAGEFCLVNGEFSNLQCLMNTLK